MNFDAKLRETAEESQRDALARCAVALHCHGGAEEEWFHVHFADAPAGAPDAELHYCPRHALAAEALGMMVNGRGVPDLLRLTEKTHDEPPLAVSVRVL